MKRISISELAARLKVSKTLISLVLNGKGDQYGINKDTQLRVMEAAAKLNYKPNLMARGLRTGTSRTIGVVVADISNPYYSRIAKSIEDSVSKHGYNIVVCSTEENRKKEQVLINSLVNEHNVAGLIVASTQQNATQFTQLKKQGFPVVLLDREIASADSDYVGVDNYKGAFAATEHLLKKGYRKIALLKITPSFLSTINERAEGYKSALAKHGLRTDKSLIHEIEFTKLRDDVRKAMKKLTTDRKADAVFFLNSNLAAFALEYLNEKKISVPDTLAVVCFDDVEFFRFTNPPVTAVAQPLEEIGAASAKLLLEQLQALGKSTKPKRLSLKPELIIRKSS